MPGPDAQDDGLRRCPSVDAQSHQAGVEGVVAKRLAHGYRPKGRTWSKIRTPMTAEAIVGGVLGSLEHPEALILGRSDRQGRLHVAGRTGLLLPQAHRDRRPAHARSREPPPMASAILSSYSGGAECRVSEVSQPHFSFPSLECRFMYETGLPAHGVSPPSRIIAWIVAIAAVRSFHVDRS